MNGLVKINRYLIKLSLNNYAVNSAEALWIISYARAKWVKERIGKKHWFRSMNTREEVELAFLPSDGFYKKFPKNFTKDYINEEDAKLCQAFYHCVDDQHWYHWKEDLEIHRSLYKSLEAMYNTGGECYITPAQAMFINTFKETNE